MELADEGWEVIRILFYYFKSQVHFQISCRDFGLLNQIVLIQLLDDIAKSKKSVLLMKLELVSALQILSVCFEKSIC